MLNVKLYLLIIFYSITISIFFTLSIFLISSNEFFSSFYGIIYYCSLLFCSIKLYKLLPQKKDIIPRLITCKAICFLIITFIPFLEEFKTNYTIQLKFAKYALESTISESESEDGYHMSSYSNKIIYPINKPINKLDENIRDKKLKSITRGYGVISGYTEINMDISFWEKIFISGLEFIFEIIIMSWFSIAMSLVLFYFEYKYNLLVSLGLSKKDWKMY